MNDTSPRPGPRGGFPLLAACSAVTAGALVPFRYLPTEDGPTNIASAHIIGNHTGAFATYFDLDFTPRFDTLWQLTLTVLSKVMPALVAERAMVVALVVALPLAGWYALRGLRPDAGVLAYALLPLSIGFFQHAGYHGFSLGLVLSIVSLGWWLRHRDSGPRAWAVLGALLLLTYLAHVLPAVLAIGVMVSIAVWDRLTGDGEGSWREVARIGVASLPTFGLLGWYLSEPGRASGFTRIPIGSLLKGMVSLRAIVVSYDEKERIFALLLGLTLIAVALYTLVRLASRSWRDVRHGWLLVTVGLGGLYFVVPDGVHDGNAITARILLFVIVTLLCWMASHVRPARLDSAIVVVALLVTAGLTALHVQSYREFDRDLREYASVGDQLFAGATVLPVNLVQPDEEVAGLAYSVRVRPVIQATGYLVAERDVVDLSHFNAQYDYFITQFRRDVNPFELIANGEGWLDDDTPALDLADYPERSNGRGRVDFVLVWGEGEATEETLTSPEVRQVRLQLAQDYELVYTSTRGLVHLYRHR